MAESAVILLPKPRKGVKGPSVPCGVSLVTFFPLVERKLPVGDRTRLQYGKEHRKRQRPGQPLRFRFAQPPPLTQGRLGMRNAKDNFACVKRAYLLETNLFLVQKAIKFRETPLDEAFFADNIHQTGTGGQHD